MVRLRRPWLEGSGFMASVALHLAVAAALAAGVGRSSTRSYGPTRVNFEVVAPSPPLAPPAAAPIRPAPAPARAARIEAPADPPEPPREPPPPSAPIDLTGVTLTGEGATWSSLVGNGARMDGAIETPRQASASTSPAVEPRVGRRPATLEPALVPIADLFRRPVPPRLDSVLKRHYPAEARQRGLSGVAVVRARIDADGRVRIASISSESYAGFGEACRKTVVGSVWLPSQDRVGHPVATEVSYTCRFRVEQ
jgi:protein TonB